MSDTALEQRISEATGVFAKDVGEWEVEMEIRPAPDVAPVHLKGTSSNRLIGGGRWLVIDHKADSGFEGHGIYGWDASTGKYTGVWVDSMQTCITRSEGIWDAAARTMTFVTTGTHGDKPIRYREITESKEDGTRVYRNLIQLPNGEEFEMIRAVHRRKS
ncbi:MAG TPA: DUF1579 domain-containing protein [Candidatus Eisenbacteria bacterium]|nr:DUF1579 domain-containing protein [Candidatus Eisenbacteria bacterium]